MATSSKQRRSHQQKRNSQMLLRWAARLVFLSALVCGASRAEVMTSAPQSQVSADHALQTRQVQQQVEAHEIRPGPAGNILKLSTLEWPPYTGSKLPDQGETSQLLTRVFQYLGYQVQIQVMPWAEAMAVVNQSKHGFRGFFPEYPLSDARYLQSTAIGYSEIGLVESVKKPLLLTSMLQLATLKVGVVAGYLNMAELDLLIAQGKVRPVRNQSDQHNILQVATGKLDAAVIDKRVLQYLLKHDAELAPLAAQVQFSQSLIEHRSLHLVLPANPENQALLLRFNQALGSIKNQYVGSY